MSFCERGYAVKFHYSNRLIKLLGFILFTETELEQKYLLHQG